MTEREEIHTYYDGVKEGLWKYARWKDGLKMCEDILSEIPEND
jgi:hypothetical protein